MRRLMCLCMHCAEKFKSVYSLSQGSDMRKRECDGCHKLKMTLRYCIENKTKEDEQWMT